MSKTATNRATVDSLDGLSVGTVLLCADGRVREVAYSGSRSTDLRPSLRGFDGGIDVVSSRIARLLPATVLHQP